MIDLVTRTGYLIDKQIKSLEEKHKREGGFTEKLYHDRVEFRKRNNEVKFNVMLNKTNYFEKDRVKIKYFETGEGESLIFLHGGGIRALTYKKCLDCLSKKYKVYAPDLPNFGGSSIPSKIWDFSDYANFLSEFIDSLPVKNVTILGHSFGGGIALHLANRNQKIKKVILANPAGMIRINSLRKAYFHFFIKKTIDDLLINPFITFIPLKDFAINLFTRLGKAITIFRMVNLTVREKIIDLSEIRVPTLILWGENDEIYSRKEIESCKFSDFTKVEYIKGNHDWILFKPELLIEKIFALG
jgi:four helix bundle suffix protein